MNYFKLVIFYNTNLLKISEKLKKEPENTTKIMNMILIKIQNIIEKILGYTKENVDEQFIKNQNIFTEHNKYYENQIEIFNKIKNEL